MISVDRIPKLYERLASIFEYGLDNQYSLETMQERIASCDMFRRLENGDDSFLYERTTDDEINNVYSIFDKIDTKNYSSRSLWISEAYLRLFFKYHKSVSYILLYISIGTMLDLYHVYHEMDWTQLFMFFEEKTKEITILKKLLDKRQLSVNKLSQLTGISENTIDRFCRNDEYLYGTKYEFIAAISRVLNVNTNVFLKEVFNYTNSDNYSFDKFEPKYRSYLGLYLASYYCRMVEQRKYLLNEQDMVFESGDQLLKVLCTDSVKEIEAFSKTNLQIEKIVSEYSSKTSYVVRQNTILVIFEYNQTSDTYKPYLKLTKYGFQKIIIINQSYIMCINDNSWISYLSSYVYNLMIEKAKKTSGGDFAI